VGLKKGKLGVVLTVIGFVGMGVGCEGIECSED
jgi:hypothetical protein